MYDLIDIEGMYNITHYFSQRGISEKWGAQ